MWFIKTRSVQEYIKILLTMKKWNFPTIKAFLSALNLLTLKIIMKVIDSTSLDKSTI